MNAAARLAPRALPALLALALGPPASAGDDLGLFPRRLALQTAFGTWESVVGDFDGDGLADVATTSHSSFEGQTVTLHRGRADGGFHTATAQPVADDSVQLAAGDVLGDGTLDLATSGDNGLWILQNPGDGGPFLEHFVSGSADEDNASDVALADLDGDGLVDLLALDLSFPPRLVVRLGLPGAAPAFATPVVIALPETGGLGDELALGDLDGDFDLDVALAALGGALILENVAGVLAAPSTLDMRVETTPELTLVDPDGDGLADVAVIADGLLVVRRALGGGAFGPLFTRASVPAQWLRAGDFNGDGVEDLLAFGTDDTLALHRGRPNGVFAPATITPYASGLVRRLAVGRGPGDARDDLFVSEFYHVTVVQPGPGGDMPAFPGLTEGGGSNLRAGDVNGDGNVDLVSSLSLELHVQLARQGGTFGEVKISPAPPVTLDDLVLLDFDGDGQLDVATLEGSGSDLLGIGLGNGAGRFSAPTSVAVGTGSWSELDTADLDGDGRGDIVSGSGFTVSAVFGDASGVPGLPVILADDAPSVGQLALGDADGDGFLDLLVARTGSGRHLSLLLSDTTGGFDPALTISTTVDAKFPLLGDMDGDGVADAAAFSDDGVNVHDRLVQFRGVGDGSFGPPVVSPSWASVRDAALADMDGDGRLEVLAAGTFGQGTLAVYHDLTGQPGDQAVGWDPGIDARRMALGDFDGDGDIDVALGESQSSPGVRLVWNQLD